LFGKPSDIYGRRRMMLVASAWFVLGRLPARCAPHEARSRARARRASPDGPKISSVAQTVWIEESHLAAASGRAFSPNIDHVPGCSISAVLGGAAHDHVALVADLLDHLRGDGRFILTYRALRPMPRNDPPTHRLISLRGASEVAAAADVDAGRFGLGRSPISVDLETLCGLFGRVRRLWVIAFEWRPACGDEPFIRSMRRSRVVFASRQQAFLAARSAGGRSHPSTHRALVPCSIHERVGPQAIASWSVRRSARWMAAVGMRSSSHYKARAGGRAGRHAAMIVVCACAGAISR